MTPDLILALTVCAVYLGLVACVGLGILAVASLLEE